MRSDAIRAEADMEDGMRAKDDGRHNGHAGAGQTRDRASTSSGPSSRAVLPIPDVPPPGLTTYDAKDPDEAEEPIAAGTRQVRMEFDYDGGGLGKGGDVRLYYDGEQAGEGRVEATHPLIFSADETTDVAYEAGTPVSAAHTRERFHGDVKWVKIELGSDMHDHRVDREDPARVAMSLQ